MQAATELGRQYDANYNDKKPAAMAALYTLDGVLLSPSGSVARGRTRSPPTMLSASPLALEATPSKSLKSMSRAMAAMASPTSQ